MDFTILVDEVDEPWVRQRLEATISSFLQYDKFGEIGTRMLRATCSQGRSPREPLEFLQCAAVGLCMPTECGVVVHQQPAPIHLLCFRNVTLAFVLVVVAACHENSGFLPCNMLVCKEELASNTAGYDALLREVRLHQRGVVHGLWAGQVPASCAVVN